MAKSKEQHKEIIKEFPTGPGVYLMKGAGKVIYVGKAKSLRTRVRSYFQNGKNVSVKTVHLVQQIQDIEYILTKSEVEAFLLEASLIKKHRPKYNIRLKDDKAYPYIRVSMSDEYPRFYLVRKVKADKDYYFGPYTSGLHVRETIRFLNRTFRIRDCKDGFFKTRKRPCITYQIGRCSAPCVSLITSKDYGLDIRGALDFLRGRKMKVVKELSRKMKEAAKNERFEAAAKLRNSIEAVEAILEKQAVVSVREEIDQDIIAYFGDERGTLIETLHIRAGRVIGTRPHFMPRLDVRAEGEDPKEWLTSFINQYYIDNFVPDEIVLPVDLSDDLYKLLQAVFVERGHKKPRFVHALDKDAGKLMEMAISNAESHFKDHVNKQTNVTRILEEIQAKFHMTKPPLRIECFDISNFQGSEIVASQVVFEDAVPKRSDYRRYRIRSVAKGASNDYASMKEVLERRFRHTEYDDPDLVVIDGGKGQLNIAIQVMKAIGREDITLAGMAKARTEGDFHSAEVESSEERFFLKGRSNPVIFHHNSEALKILVSLRDEAHRFAITYHRNLRDRRIMASQLDSIHGLGDKKKALLLKHFGSVSALSLASTNEIAALPGFTLKLAEEILKNLKTEDQPSS